MAAGYVYYSNVSVPRRTEELRARAVHDMEQAAHDALFSLVENQQTETLLIIDPTVDNAVIYHQGEEGIRDGEVHYSLCGQAKGTYDPQSETMSIPITSYIAHLTVRWDGAPNILPYGEGVIQIRDYPTRSFGSDSNELKQSKALRDQKNKEEWDSYCHNEN